MIRRCAEDDGHERIDRHSTLPSITTTTCCCRCSRITCPIIPRRRSNGASCCTIDPTMRAGNPGATRVMRTRRSRRRQAGLPSSSDRGCHRSASVPMTLEGPGHERPRARRRVPTVARRVSSFGKLLAHDDALHDESSDRASDRAPAPVEWRIDRARVGRGGNLQTPRVSRRHHAAFVGMRFTRAERRPERTGPVRCQEQGRAAQGDERRSISRQS